MTFIHWSLTSLSNDVGASFTRLSNDVHCVAYLSHDFVRSMSDYTSS